MIDGERGPEEQDAKILGLAHEEGKGIVLAVNKWDLVEKDHKTIKAYTDNVRDVFKFAPYAPIVYISALSGKRCPRIIQAVKTVAIERLRRISTNRLNKLLERSLKRRPLPIYRGRRVRLYYSAQVAKAPPRFCLLYTSPSPRDLSTSRMPSSA